MTTPRSAYLCGTPFDEELRSGEMTQLDLAPIAYRLGAQGVEYRTVYWKDRESEIPAVVGQLRSLGLACTYATFATLFDPDPARREQLLVDIDDAARLGARLLRVFLGERSEGAEAERQVRDAIDHATGAGVVLAIENYVKAPGNTLADIVFAMDRFGSPSVGTNIDIGNYVKNGQDPQEAAKRLGGWAVYCHLKDIREGPEGKVTCAPGTGTLPLDAIVGGTGGIPWEVPVAFEYPGDGDPEGAVARGLAFVRQLR